MKKKVKASGMRNVHIKETMHPPSATEPALPIPNVSASSVHVNVPSGSSSANARTGEK